MQRTMLGESLRDELGSLYWTRVTDTKIRKAEMIMAHSSENRWMLGSQGAGTAISHRKMQRQGPEEVDGR
ncbi:jg16851 [Pararge aegeria aegeria]|uniref:Jg16851 protein n=1 Tax=Pararge aegeria aegeria TaxID=348720 RepID=A0A8S4QTE6_9NEOP|nr:jg16851 [Pararge aegeria aegeria]